MNARPRLAYLDDPRNDDVLVYVDGALIPRDQAAISVYDNGLAMGDALCESMRLVQGRIGLLDAHLDRLIAGAELMAFEPLPTRLALTRALTTTAASNDMVDGANLRLLVTRGRKRMPDQDPRSALGPPTIIIIPEYRVFRPQVDRAIALTTSTIRYAAPESSDLRLKSPGRLDHIRALMQAIGAGGDAALMLDRRGFVAGCNAANFFIVRRGELWTSTVAFCVDGITRRSVLRCWRGAGGTVHEGDMLPADLLKADEAFVTNSLDGITAVGRIDQRQVGDGARGAITTEIAQLYEASLIAD